MSDSIIVKVSDLRSLVQDVRRGGMDYVEISVSEADDELPASLNLSACSANDTHTWVDFEPLDAVDNAESLQKDSFYGVHMSSNLL